MTIIAHTFSTQILVKFLILSLDPFILGEEEEERGGGRAAGDQTQQDLLGKIVLSRANRHIQQYS